MKPRLWAYPLLAACLLLLVAQGVVAFHSLQCLAPVLVSTGGKNACQVLPLRPGFVPSFSKASRGMTQNEKLASELRGASPFGRDVSIFLAADSPAGDSTEEEQKLRDELAGLFGNRGRDQGMKKLKAPKGSIEALRQQAQAKPDPPAAPLSPPPAANTSPDEAAQPPTPIAPPQRPKPEPTYEDLDSLLKGGPSRVPQSSPPPAPSGPVPSLSRPAYEVGGGGSGVALPAWDKGDRVPAEGWEALLDSAGEAVTKPQFSGTPYLLVVPEPAHHTGAPTDTWCRLLVDLKDKLGSQREDLAILAVSPEPTELHAKMQKKWGFKFALASDPDRTLLAALRVWNPDASSRGITIDRQSFLIDTAQWTFAEVFRGVGVTGHAETVKDALERRAQGQGEEGQGQGDALAAAPSVIAPPMRPPASEEEEEEAAAEGTKAEGAVEETAVDVTQSLAPPARPLGAAVSAEGGAEEEGEEELPVPADAVGSLIGVRGMRVKQLTKESGATLVKFESDPSRMIVIGSPSQRAKAIEIAQEWISTLAEDFHPLDIALHGKLIGVGGEHVKAIQAKTGAQLRFQKEPVAGMIIRGTREERAEAFAMAERLLQKGPPDSESIKLRDELDDPTIRAIIGPKGAVVKELEQRTGARIRFSFDRREVLLVGTEEQRAAAKAEVARVEEESVRRMEGMEEETFHVAEGDQGRLVGPGGTRVREIEEKSGASVTMAGPGGKPGVVIRGTKEQRALAWELAQQLLNADAETHEVPSAYHRLVIGPGGSTVRRIEEETGARVISFRDETPPRFLFRGSAEQRATAWAKVQELMGQQDHPDTVEVGQATAMRLLAGKAAALKEIEGATGSSIAVVRGSPGEEVVSVEVRGRSEQRERAKQMLDEYSKNSVGSETVLLSELGRPGDSPILNLRRLIGPKGVRIQRLEKQTGAFVKLQQRPEPRLIVTGSPEARAKVLSIVKDELTSLSDERVPLPAAQHGSLIGVGGRTIQQLEEQSGAQISFETEPDAAMVLRGTPEQREAARRLTAEYLEGDAAATMTVPVAEQAMLIGANGRNVREVERESGARVQVLTPTNQDEVLAQNPQVAKEAAGLEEGCTLIVVRGTEKQRAEAMHLLQELVDEDKTDEMPIPPDQAKNVRSALGQRVRAIERTSGARIRLRETPATVVIRGTEAQRAAAWAEVEVMLAEEEEERELASKHGLLAVRLIIGPGGQRVRDLEQASGARIQFDTSDGVKVQVRGTPAARTKAWDLLQELQDGIDEEAFPLAKEKHYVVIGPRGDTVKRLELQSGAAVTFTVTPTPAMIVMGNATARAEAWRLAQTVLEDCVEVEQERLHIDARHHATLIGSNGNRVRQIEQESGAKVQFQREEDVKGGACLVTGTAAQREAAHKMMLQFIEDDEEERFPVPVEAHRVLIGVRGSTVKRLEAESMTSIGFESTPEPAMVVRGSAEGRAKARELAEAVLTEGQQEEQFYVENRYHGYLIGPQGTTVRELETQSNTRIRVSEEEPIVTVRGSQQDRDTAWELIQARMDEYDEGRDQ